MAFIDRLEKVYSRMLRLSDRSSEGHGDGGTVDQTGSATSCQSSDARFFAIAELMLHGDVSFFRKSMADSGLAIICLFERRDAGEPIDGSYVTMLRYKSLYSCLASGDTDMAERLATLIGGRDAIEKRFDSRFTRALGYMTKAAVLDNRELFDKWYPDFEIECEDEYYAFEGLGNTLRSVLDRDLEGAIAGIQKVADEHKILSKDKDWFYDSEDELLSIFGIGVANLARHRGLDVPAVPPFIPAELLIEVNRSDK